MFRASIYLLLCFILSCKSYHTTAVQWDEYHLEVKKIPLDADSAVSSIIFPYKAALDSQMNVVIGFNTKALSSKKPEGSLGNFFADAIREQTEILYRNYEMAY